MGLRQPSWPHSVGCAWSVVSAVGARLGGKPREEAGTRRRVWNVRGRYLAASPVTFGGLKRCHEPFPPFKSRGLILCPGVRVRFGNSLLTNGTWLKFCLVTGVRVCGTSGFRTRLLASPPGRSQLLCLRTHKPCWEQPAQEAPRPLANNQHQTALWLKECAGSTAHHPSQATPAFLIRRNREGQHHCAKPQQWDDA